MSSAVFDYDEIRKRVQKDYLFSHLENGTSAPAPYISSTGRKPAVLSCGCGRTGS